MHIIVRSIVGTNSDYNAAPPFSFRLPTSCAPQILMTNFIVSFEWDVTMLQVLGLAIFVSGLLIYNVNKV